MAKMTPPNMNFLEIFFVLGSKFIYKTLYQFNKKIFFFFLLQALLQCVELVIYNIHLKLWGLYSKDCCQKGDLNE